MSVNVRFALVALAPIALAACGGAINDARNIQPTGNAFDTALYQGYIGRAEHEYGYSHYQSSDAFAIKARAAAAGQPVEPFTPNDNAYPSGLVPEGDLSAMMMGRAALVDVLAASATTKAPQDAADAQVNFDCWVEEQSYINNFFEDDQPDHAQACRDAFEASLARAQEAVKPAPAPAPAPVVQVPANYIVFFDWDSSVLTAEALGVLQQAAGNFPTSKFTRIQIVGHADKSGAAAYNAGLSRVRAQNVVDALARQGVDPGKIDVAWRGETDPLVPTTDGIREPQNRRAEIVFK